ncbi:MAG: extracellular solute-binding protein [Firmicutes bacterium]|nr:extracellular solute-binding protein [Bacillota bacterium]
MKITKFVTLFIISVFVFLMLNACGDGSESVHEPLTIITAHKDYTEFEKEFKKAYPEVNLKFISYSGHNSTSYLHRILEAGQAPDIYTSNVLPDAELQKKYLIDLSGYDFSTKYAVSRLNECSINGAIYMLPCNYSVMGIYYNKTLFEDHGWSVPTSFYELEELLPKIKAAGVDVSATAMELTGSGFQYLFNLGDTVFLRTPEGLDWVEQFLNEEVTADAAWASTIEYMQKWIDLGIINGNWYGKTTKEALSHFQEGNTALFIHGGIFRFTQNTDGSGDQYGLMPWLSLDGSNNRYITNTACYFGLNADLEKPGNKQKLEDALKFMAFISTEKGQRLLPGNRQQLLPLIDSGNAAEGEYREIINMLNAGYSAPITYAGWEDMVVPIGAECLKWYAGKSTGEQVIAAMNRAVHDSNENKTGSCADIMEDLTLEETARLVGHAFAEAAQADCSLISLGDYHEGKENDFGVNGRLFKGSVNDVIISTVNPLGWVDTIKTFTLTGAEIKQLADKGFDLYDDGNPFPYVLTVTGDTGIDDSRKYTVVICGYTDEVKNKGEMQDTKLCGMDALRDYLTEQGVVTKAKILGANK